MLDSQPPLPPKADANKYSELKSQLTSSEGEFTFYKRNQFIDKHSSKTLRNTSSQTVCG